MAMRIKDVEECFKLTLARKATPHRTPNFERLYKTFGEDAQVKGTLWFLEEHNTGYPGVLERWEFTPSIQLATLVPRSERVSFWADLLPGLIATMGRSKAEKSSA